MNIEKLAAALYNYTASAKNNYYPPRPSIPPALVFLQGGPKDRKATIPPAHKLPEVLRGSNPRNLRDTDTWPFLHPWNNSISGTGTGRPYWPYPENPYRT